MIPLMFSIGTRYLINNCEFSLIRRLLLAFSLFLKFVINIDFKYAKSTSKI